MLFSFFCFVNLQDEKSGILFKTGIKGEIFVKKKRALLILSACLLCAVTIFFIAGFKKPPYSKGGKTLTTAETERESAQSDVSKAENPVLELTPAILKEGSAVFSEFSVSELCKQMEQKKEILNDAVLSPTKTNHPVLDALIENRFGKDLDSLPDTFSKAKFCYDWLVENTQFGGGTVNMQNMYVFLEDCDYADADGTVVYDAYRILLTGQGVCDNYASALTVLYRYIGLEAYIVHGKAILANGTLTNHVWVAVNINDTFYWFDPQVETSAAQKNDCKYVLFCVLPDALPFYTNYSIPESCNAYHGFQLQSPMQVCCTLGTVSKATFTYKPGEVNAYGDVIQKISVAVDASDSGFPITLSLNGGTPPYQCAAQAEYRQNGKAVTQELLPTKTVTDTVTIPFAKPQGAQIQCITVRTRDASGRNLVCVLTVESK